MSSRILTAAIGGIKAAGVGAAPRALATVTAGASFKLPDMPYDYGALEPFISGEIMKIHHTKHHQVCTGTDRALGMKILSGARCL